MNSPSALPKTDPPGKHIVRTSDRLAWKRCRRSHWFGSIQHRNLVPRRGSKPLEFGTDMHEAWGVYYDPETWHLIRNKTHRPLILESALQTFIQSNKARRVEASEVGGGLSIDIEEDFDEREKLGVGMLKAYFDWAPTVDNFTVKYVEVDFEVPILTPEGTEMTCSCHDWPVVYQGRLDGIVQDASGWYWILEHKTAAQLGPTDHLALDEQTGSYCWAVQHMLGIRVAGVIYNEAVKKVPHTPQELMRPQDGRRFSVNKMQDTTYEIASKFLVEQGEDLRHYEIFLDFLRIQGNKFFRRTQVHRNTYELSDQGRRIYYEAKEMLNPETVPYPNPSRFNCQMCAFRTPCLAMNDGSDYEYILNEDFRIRTQEEVDSRRAR